MGDKSNLDDTSKDNVKSLEERGELDTITPKEPSPVYDPRREMMEQVTKTAAEARATSRKEFLDDTGFDADELIRQESGHLPKEDDKAGDDGLDTETLDKTEKVPEVVDKPQKTDDTQIIEHEGNQFLKLKVDGVEKEISVSDAIARLQREDNADHRVWEASETQKKYETLLAQQQKPQQSTPPDDMPDTTVDTTEALKEALAKVYDGDIDDAAEALGKVLKPAAKPVNIDDVVDRKIRERDDHRDLKSAYDRFIGDEAFTAITSDPTLMSQVNTFTEDLQKDPEFLATNPTYDDYFKEAGKRVATWLDKISVKSEPDTPIVDERLERKRQQQAQPASRTVRRGPRQEEKVKSNSDIIKDMAARRGQTNL